MRVGSIEDVAWCVHEALQRDLPEVVIPAREVRGREFPERRVRPDDETIEVHAWWQSWSSTALGNGGLGGQAITSAVTTVVIDTRRRIAAVYVARQLRGIVDADVRFLERVNQRTVIKGKRPEGSSNGTSS